VIEEPEQTDEDEAQRDGLWADHLDAFTAFLAVCTQWCRITPGDGTVRLGGLDYAGVRAGLDMAGIVMTPEAWAQLQAIERGARDAWNREALA
jgi:Phage related hypothetical protein (DUF1799)